MVGPGGPVIAWILAIALADEPERRLQDVDYEVVVEREASVREARAAVDARVKELGYAKTVTLGQRSHHLHPQLWKGGVMIHEQGFARIHVPQVLPIQVRPAASGVGGEATFLLSGRRVRLGRKTAIAAALEPLLREYRDAISAREQAWRLLELHEQLHLAWEQGVAPDGASIGDAWEARRAWLVGRWLNTADNPDGAEVRARIAEFVRLRVQVSGHPFTEAELATANARAAFPDRLDGAAD